MIDERGELTYKELDERSNALANSWRKHGLKAGEGVAILARNHRGFLEAVFAAAKCGARIVLLNTSFAGPQIREVATREGTDLLVYDDEYATDARGDRRPAARSVPRLGGRARRRHARRADRRRRSERASKARRVAPDHDPDQRHDRHAEGRSALGAALAVADRRPAQQGAVPGQRGDRAVRADVPCARVHAVDRRRRARVDARGAPALRPRGHARQPRAAPRDRDGGRPGDALADRRPRRGAGQAARHLGAADHLRQRLGARRRPRPACDRARSGR